MNRIYLPYSQKQIFNKIITNNTPNSIYLKYKNTNYRIILTSYTALPVDIIGIIYSYTITHITLDIEFKSANNILDEYVESYLNITLKNQFSLMIHSVNSRNQASASCVIYIHNIKRNILNIHEVNINNEKRVRIIKMENEFKNEIKQNRDNGIFFDNYIIPTNNYFNYTLLYDIIQHCKTYNDIYYERIADIEKELHNVSNYTTRLESKKHNNWLCETSTFHQFINFIDYSVKYDDFRPLQHVNMGAFFNTYMKKYYNKNDYLSGKHTKCTYNKNNIFSIRGYDDEEFFVLIQPKNHKKIKQTALISFFHTKN